MAQLEPEDPGTAVRRKVRFEPVRPVPPVGRTVPVRPTRSSGAHGRHRRPSRSWLHLTERVVTDWQNTLRAVLLVIVVGLTLGVIMLATLALALTVGHGGNLLRRMGALLRRAF